MEEEEVVLGLIPAPDWVENRPLEEGGEIELAVAKKLKHSQEAEQMVEMNPKKENDSIEEITLDSGGEECREVKIKPEEVIKIKTETSFHAGNEGAEIEAAEEKPQIPTPIVFPTREEDGEMKVKEEERHQIEPSTEYPEAEENEEENIPAEYEPLIEAVTVFSDSDEGECIEIKEEEEVQIETITVYPDTYQSGEDSFLIQENTRYNVQNNGGDAFTLAIAPPQATVIETAVQDVYGCNTCPSSFSCTSELSRHVRSHPPRRKPFVCRVCMKTDSLAANLKRHMRTHSGEKPYSCVLCFKMFTSAYSLKIHMRIHSGYKPYTCKKCPRAFYQKTDLNKHSLMHSRGEKIPTPKDPNPVKQNVEVRSPPPAKVTSRGANSRLQKILPAPSHFLLSDQLSLEPVNGNSENEDSRNTNSQTESPSDALRYSPTPFAPVITEVVGSFHEEDSEMQPCPSPPDSGGPQNGVAFRPTSSAGDEIRMEKVVYSQPVINSVNSQVTNSTVALRDTAVPASSSGDTHIAAKKNAYAQPEAFSASSQKEVNSGTSLISPVQLSTNVVQNNASSAAAAAPGMGLVNNFMPSQTGGDIFCIPLIINGQMCYVIPTPASSQLVVNNPAPVQPAVQPNNSHPVSGPESFLFPVFVPPISNGVSSPELARPAAAPAVTPQTSVLGSASPSQPQHQIGFRPAPVGTAACVQPENSSASQMTITNTVPCVQSENSTGSQITAVDPAPHVRLKNSVGSQVQTMKTVPEVWPENSSGFQIRAVETVTNSVPEKSSGTRVTTVKSASRSAPNKKFTRTPKARGTVQLAPHHEHHHNHELTFTMKSSNGVLRHERVFCNTCKAPITVLRSKEKKVS